MKVTSSIFIIIQIHYAECAVFTLVHTFVFLNTEQLKTLGTDKSTNSMIYKNDVKLVFHNINYHREMHNTTMISTS